MLLKILIFIIILYILEVHSYEKSKNLKRQEPTEFRSCFENLGCLDTTEEWFHDVHRPRNLEPLDRHTIRTELILITKDPDQKPLNYETINIKKAEALEGYSKDKPLIILIHDFTSNGYTGWIKHFASTVLHKLGANIISVDWEAGAEPPFEQAIANARVVALEIRAFLNILKNSSSLAESSVHMIGHGVGAHIAGYVGTCIKIGKISGLDPTGPFFEDLPPVVRLDPTDAQYVEVIHTDAFNGRSQGGRKTLGHADFYINGAQAQPQCNQSTEFPVFTKIDRNILKEGVILPACSHKRAFKYYIEALDPKDCQFTGIGCESYKKFSQGKCTSCENGNSSNCATFGLSSTNPCSENRKFYTNTRGEPPFCLNSYRIEINFENNAHAKKHQEGTFELIMVDNAGIMINASAGTTATRTFESGKSYSMIFYASPPRMKDIIEARLKWVHNPNSLCVFCNTAVYVNRIVIKLLSATKGSNHGESCLCPEQGKSEIDNGNFVTFKKCMAISKLPTWAGNITTISPHSTTQEKSEKSKNCGKLEKKP